MDWTEKNRQRCLLVHIGRGLYGCKKGAFIYIAGTNLDMPLYIGKTTTPVYQRIEKHFQDNAEWTHHVSLLTTIDLIELSSGNLDTAERYYIAQMRPRFNVIRYTSLDNRCTFAMAHRIHVMPKPYTRANSFGYIADCIGRRVNSS
jgi:hypothetical protein